MVLYQPTPFRGEEQSVVYGNGGGALKMLKGNHVLHVWGTPEERAYAIGFLCAPQILDWLNFVVIEHYCTSAAFYENAFIPSVKAQLGGLYDTYSNELDALLTGMRASSASVWRRFTVTQGIEFAGKKVRFLAKPVNTQDVYFISG